jgi:AraC-like DNA-binding protein
VPLRAPDPRLRAFVRQVWAQDGAAPPTARAERVLPTGDMHVVFRLGAAPLALWRPGGFEAVAHAVVGGVRESAYIRALTPGGPSVGAQLRPGAAEALFGVPAHHLARAHTPLADLWGAFAAEAHARLAEAPDPEARLRRLEALLLARLDPARALHPALAHGLLGLRRGWSVDAVVAESGWSHRHFIRRFEAAVGATPKLYARLRRLQRILRGAADPGRAWVDLAGAAGFADQAHLVREFRALTGLTPGEYRRARPAAAHHVAVDAAWEVSFLQDAGRPPGQDAGP